MRGQFAPNRPVALIVARHWWLDEPWPPRDSCVPMWSMVQHVSYGPDSHMCSHVILSLRFHVGQPEAGMGEPMLPDIGAFGSHGAFIWYCLGSVHFILQEAFQCWVDPSIGLSVVGDTPAVTSAEGVEPT